MQSRGCPTPTIELVQKPSLIFKFKGMATQQFFVPVSPAHGISMLFFQSSCLCLLSTWLCCKCIASFGADCRVFHSCGLYIVRLMSSYFLRQMTCVSFQLFPSPKMKLKVIKQASYRLGLFISQEFLNQHCILSFGANCRVFHSCDFIVCLMSSYYLWQMDMHILLIISITKNEIESDQVDFSQPQITYKSTAPELAISTDKQLITFYSRLL